MASSCVTWDVNNLNFGHLRCKHIDPGDMSRKPRIQWPKGNQTATWTNLDQELSFLLTIHLKGPINHQLSSFCRVVYDVCLEWLGAVMDKKDKTEEKWPNRRQIQKGKLRSEQRMLKRRLKEASIHERLELQNILNDIQKRILVISRAENQRKHRKKKCQDSTQILMLSQKTFHGIKERQAWCTKGGTRESFEDDILRWFKRYPNTSSKRFTKTPKSNGNVWW